MNWLFLFSLVGAAALAFTACTTPLKIQYDAVRDYDFSKPKTFALIRTDRETSVQVGPGAIEAAKSGLIEALESKGLAEAPAAEADVLVAMHLEMTDKVDVIDFGYTYGAYRGYGYGYGGALMGSTVTTTEYKDATLAIDIVNNAEDTLIWRGWASKNIYGDTKATVPDEDRAKIRMLIANILANYPPPETLAK